MRDGLSTLLAQRWLAQSPHIWGKLPSHGDYVHYRVSPAQAQGWKSWVDQVWHLCPLHQKWPGAATPTAKQVQAQAGWLHLEAAAGQPDLSVVPVAFVLPPGTLSFAPRQHVQGVLIPSEDKMGRACPFIVYQQVSRSWLARTWTMNDVRSQPTGQDVLYWWARVAARMQGSERDFVQCCQAVDAVWHHQAPGWRQLMGAAPSHLTREPLEHALGPYRQRDELDAAWGLQGVQHLPWRNWPQRAWTTSAPSAVFWQQDMHGGYVNAGESLLELWGVR